MFYGWKIVGVTYVTHFIAVGFVFYSYGIFFEALESEFEASRLGVSGGLATMNVAMALFAPILGRAVDKYSIRWIMVVGAVLMAMGFFLAVRIESLFQFYLILATLLGMGTAMIGFIPNSTLIANWFVRRRGTAFGIATMGVSLSGMVMAPACAKLISEIGWRYTFIILGLTAVSVIVPLVLSHVVNRPEDMGLTPDGDPPEISPSTEANLETGEENASTSWSARRVLCAGNFWAITVSIGLIFFSLGGTLIHMVKNAIDHGVPLESASYILAASAGVGVLGKLLFGWIADHISARRALWIAITFAALGTFFFMRSSGYASLIAAAGVFGFGMGGIVPLWSTLVGDIFGREYFGRVMGIMSPCMVPFQALGVPYAGYIYDRTHSYTIAYQTFIVVYGIAAIAALFIRTPKRIR